MSWQPIETAPVPANFGRGETVLLFHPVGGVVVGRHWGVWSDDHGHDLDPTHWQPLPEPPA